MEKGTKKRGVDPMEQCDLGLILANVTTLIEYRAIN